MRDIYCRVQSDKSFNVIFCNKLKTGLTMFVFENVSRLQASWFSFWGKTLPMDKGNVMRRRGVVKDLTTPASSSVDANSTSVAFCLLPNLSRLVINQVVYFFSVNVARSRRML